MLSLRLRYLGSKTPGKRIWYLEPLLRWEPVCRADKESSAQFLRVEPWVSARGLEATCLADVFWAARRASLRSLVLGCPMEKKFGIAGHHGVLWRPLETVAETIGTSTGPWSMGPVVQSLGSVRV